MTTLAITPETLPAITWQNIPVITTELLADVYGAKSIHIQQNFKNNASRFKEGIHYFKLVGEELKAFILQLDKIELQISNMTRSLMLWTERGTVRHAKILDTDNAWLVQDRLEDSYFAKNTQPQYGLKQLPDPKTKLALPGGLTLDMQDTIKAMVKANAAILPKEKQAGAIIRQWSAIKKKFGCSYKEVSPDNYINILSLLSRLPLEGEVLPKEVLPKETNPLLTDNAYRNEARLAFDDYLEFCNATMRQAGVKPPEQWPVIDSKTVDGLVASMMWNSQWVMSFDPGTMQPSIRSIPFDALLMPETKAIDYLTKQRGYIVMKESELLSKIRA